MRVIRSTLAFILPALAGLLAFVLLIPLGRRRAANASLTTLALAGLKLGGIRLRVTGDAAQLHRRPAVFVINHQSATDPLIVAALLRRDVIGVVKSELKRHPVGPLMRLYGAVFVRRDTGAGPAMLAPALAPLRQGYAIALAPEGRRSRDGSLQSFHPGAIWLARQAGVPVIPIVLHNSVEILPPGAWCLRPGTVRVSVLAPLPPDTATVHQLERVYRHALVAG